MSRSHFLIIFISIVSLSPLFPRTQACVHLVPSFARSWFAAKTSISTDPNGVQFYLYKDPKNPEVSQELVYLNSSSIHASALDPTLPLLILTHGFTQNHTSSFPTNLKNAYLEAGYGNKVNLITVNWGPLSANDFFDDEQDIPIFVEDLASLPVYQSVTLNVPIVGKRIQEFVSFLIKVKGVNNPWKTHLVGFSLGAHISGAAGTNFYNQTGTKFARITGLDPAGLCFQDADPQDRLDPTDAHFVTITHTNDGALGYSGALGDVDFYLNGGFVQPDCVDTIREVTGTPSCSHSSAPIFYGSSILNSTIHASSCHYTLGIANHCKVTPIIYGEHVQTSANGEYEVDIDLDQLNKA